MTFQLLQVTTAPSNKRGGKTSRVLQTVRVSLRRGLHVGGGSHLHVVLLGAGVLVLLLLLRSRLCCRLHNMTQPCQRPPPCCTRFFTPWWASLVVHYSGSHPTGRLSSSQCTMCHSATIVPVSRGGAPAVAAAAESRLQLPLPCPAHHWRSGSPAPATPPSPAHVETRFIRNKFKSWSGIDTSASSFHLMCAGQLCLKQSGHSLRMHHSTEEADIG